MQVVVCMLLATTSAVYLDSLGSQQTTVSYSSNSVNHHYSVNYVTPAPTEQIKYTTPAVTYTVPTITLRRSHYYTTRPFSIRIPDGDLDAYDLHGLYWPCASIAFVIYFRLQSYTTLVVKVVNNDFYIFYCSCASFSFIVPLCHMIVPLFSLSVPFFLSAHFYFQIVIV